MMKKDQNIRRGIATKSHFMFFVSYFQEYYEYPFASFHQEMFQLSEDESMSTLVITAARGTGKSTILNTSYAIWSILGAPKKKFVVILGDTRMKAQQHFTNIRKVLEENKWLREDLGPFKADSGEWGSSLVIPKYNAKIIFASTGQSIRGIRHNQYRPDLIIADDLEDNDSVRTFDSRNKTYDWLTKDVLPAGTKITKFVLLGTLLHEDSVMMRFKRDIEQKHRQGIYREYPLIDDEGNILWPGKYPDEASIEEERYRVGDDRAWYQEFLLKIISDADRVIHPEWIQYYDELPALTSENSYRYAITGIDPAFGENERNDYTAMVSAHVFGFGKDMKTYILPNPINERVDFPRLLERAKFISIALSPDGKPTRIVAENNQAQEWFLQMLREERFPAEGVRAEKEKRIRLTLINPFIKSGQVLFPMKGAEILIQQLIGFGIERHDDLVDAFGIVVTDAVKRNPSRSPEEKLKVMQESLRRSQAGHVSMMRRVF